jgi:tRNA threonylcarbamoyladenosine biosynthesis protein TsaB
LTDQLREVALKILSVDTSSSAGSILLADDEKILAEINIDSLQTHSVRLLNGIDYLLKSLELRLNDVDAFAVISGPGSFTGLRIGLTTVKGLADTTSKSTIPIITFEAWVEKFPEQPGVIVPLIDARRGEVYATAFERTGGVCRQLTAEMVESPVRILSCLHQDKILFIGDGSIKYRELLLSFHRPQWSIATSDCFLGRAMARIAYRHALEGKYTSAQDLQAHYLRRSDAEIFWKEK